jgi:uncharacterized protein
VTVHPAPAGRRAALPADTTAVVAFFALAYALRWAWVGPLGLTHQVVHRGDGWPTHYPSLLGPLAAAFVVTGWTTGHTGVRELLARIVCWRVAARWWLAAVSPSAFLAVALFSMLVAGKKLPAAADFGRFSGTPPSAWWACSCSSPSSAASARRPAGAASRCHACSGASAP